MAWTKKEQNLLKDLQNEEKLCIEKYRKAAQAASDPSLGELFSQIAQAEQGHYNTLGKMMEGTIPNPAPAGGRQKAAGKAEPKPVRRRTSRAGKQQDAYLLADLLGTEKYVSTVYNTAVFEFGDERARQVLGGIQQQEQLHGKQLADYMQANRIYC